MSQCQVWNITNNQLKDSLTLLHYKNVVLARYAWHLPYYATLTALRYYIHYNYSLYLFINNKYGLPNYWGHTELNSRFWCHWKWNSLLLRLQCSRIDMQRLFQKNFYSEILPSIMPAYSHINHTSRGVHSVMY